MTTCPYTLPIFPIALQVNYTFRPLFDFIQQTSSLSRCCKPTLYAPEQSVSRWYSRRIAEWVLFSPLPESRRRKTAHVNATAPRCSRFSPEVAAGARLTCKTSRTHWLPRDRGRTGSEVTITCRPVVAPPPLPALLIRFTASTLVSLFPASPSPPPPPHPPQIALFWGETGKKSGEDIYWRVKKKKHAVLKRAWRSPLPVSGVCGNAVVRVTGSHT